MPARLAKCKIPVCSACMAGMMTKSNWRNKPKLNHCQSIISKPGQITSVDMMVSPTPGLIAQMTSILMRKSCKCVTMCVDQATRLGHVNLQADVTVETTLKGKQDYERHASSHGITIRGHHADNGIFKAKGWVNDCNEKNQSLTFAAINAHHQNGMAERRIRQLQDQARSMMTFSASRWPKCIDTALWPYDIMIANDSTNMSPSL